MNDGLPHVDGDPAALRSASSTLGDIGDRLAVRARQIRERTDAGASAWTGSRSVAVRFAAHGVAGQAAVAADGVTAIAHQVLRLADALDRAQCAVDDARSEIRHAEEVHAGDSDQIQRVRRIAEQRAADAVADFYRDTATIASALEQTTARATRVATTADLDALGVRRVASAAVVAAAWRVLGGWVRPELTAAPGSAAIAAIADARPATVADWWRGLSVVAQLGALRAAPDVLGNLDGLPGWARDLANRVQLGRLRADLLAGIAGVHGMLRRTALSGGTLAIGALLLRQLDARLAALRSLSGVLASPGRQLLGLQAGGSRVRAAVAVGDVDAADDVAVFTPGFTSNVTDSMDEYVDDMAALRARMDAFEAPEGRTGATVSWLGYDAPQVGELTDPVHTVVSPAMAIQGGGSLAGFLTGLDASRRHRVHLTALGHSYGSTTTGFALQHRGTGVDDAVLFGSPGYGALSSSSLHVPGGHLWDVNAPWDVVGGVCLFGGTPAHDSGFHHLSSAASPVGAGVAGHTSYLQAGSTSQWNIAAVAAAAPGATVIVRPPPRTTRDLSPTAIK